ncbi:MAG: UDP-N-acetylmuramoyl-tripeptide--D-alanyl-D-alanine ligase [Halanaerobiales bacterium]|nr:UDP-N-acetylmuramoyl-tripeptide--D-alanyl-D-alanine ligase [Halanaerobiales bacterium]
MFEYKVSEILKTVDGTLIKGNKDDILKGISTDSRNLNDEDIFIPLIGENFDAHNFINDDLAKNVKAVIVQKEIETNLKNIIKVEDTTKALQDLARFHRQNHKNVKVIGITGSSGKTSTKDILYDLLSQKYNVKKNIGNLNNHIGVPLTLFRLEGNEDFFIVEMGMSGFGEIKLLAEIANPQVGIVTNVGQAHIEFFNSVDEIAKAKGELIESLDENGLAVLNIDNSYTDILYDLLNNKTKHKYFGFNESADFRVLKYKITKSGMEFSIKESNDIINLKTNLFGKYNLYNIIASITVARNFNIEWTLIKRALKDIKLTDMRSQIEIINNIKFINDSYNANPVSMKNAIDLLDEIDGDKKIAILGDMLELGDIKEKAHQEIGEYIVKKNIDYLITIGELGSYISTGANKKHKDKLVIKHFENKVDIIKYIDKISSRRDVILIKGSRGMKMEQIINNYRKDKE